jgi:hypothetical protein
MDEQCLKGGSSRIEIVAGVAVQQAIRGIEETTIVCLLICKIASDLCSHPSDLN